MLVLAFVAAIAVGAFVAALALRRGNSQPVSAEAFSTISARPAGAISLPHGDRRTKRLGSTAGKIYLLAARDGRAFYQVGRRSHSRCYGAGDANARWPIGVIACMNAPPFFPSRRRPVFDLSSSELRKGDPHAHWFRVQGIASDAVAKIALLDRHGNTVRTLRVVDNVYLARSIPSSAAGLAALDASGRIIARMP
jgi:hypothetical protein